MLQMWLSWKRRTFINDDHACAKTFCILPLEQSYANLSAFQYCRYTTSEGINKYKNYVGSPVSILNVSSCMCKVIYVLERHTDTWLKREIQVKNWMSHGLKYLHSLPKCCRLYSRSFNMTIQILKNKFFVPLVITSLLSK